MIGIWYKTSDNNHLPSPNKCTGRAMQQNIDESTLSFYQQALRWLRHVCRADDVCLQRPDVRYNKNDTISFCSIKRTTDSLWNAVLICRAVSAEYISDFAWSWDTAPWRNSRNERKLFTSSSSDTAKIEGEFAKMIWEVPVYDEGAFV